MYWHEPRQAKTRGRAHGRPNRRAEPMARPRRV